MASSYSILSSDLDPLNQQLDLLTAEFSAFSDKIEWFKSKVQKYSMWNNAVIERLTANYDSCHFQNIDRIYQETQAIYNQLLAKEKGLSKTEAGIRYAALEKRFKRLESHSFPDLTRELRFRVSMEASLPPVKSPVAPQVKPSQSKSQACAIQ